MKLDIVVYAKRLDKMKTPSLLASDLHLTANPRDEYRWGFFHWLGKTVDRYGVHSIYFLGDLTDAKDYHPAELVNRLVESLVALAALGVEIYILKANHDYKKAKHPYFEFLSHIPHIHFITTPTESEIDSKYRIIMLPHTKDPGADWAGIDFGTYDYVFMHQTVNGATTSNGQAMQSSLSSKFEIPDYTKIYSGDIHVPQIIGDVEYVGSPYPVHFGDHFKGRVILIGNDRGAKDLYYPTIMRAALAISRPDELLNRGLRAGDQVKVRLLLAPSEKHEWDRLKREILQIGHKLKIDIHGIDLKVEQGKRRTVLGPRKISHHSPQEVVEQYVRAEDLGGDVLDIGLELME